MAGTASGPWEYLRSRSRDLGREWLAPSRTMRRRPWPPVVGLVYIAGVGVLGGLDAEHVVIGLLGLLDLYNEKSRLFLKVFLPFVLTGVVYDSMRYFYWQGIDGRVHVSEPYRFERRWLGIGGRTLNEIFQEHHWPALDLACGFAYLVYTAEYLGLAFYLFFRGRSDRARTLGRCFLVTNLMGFVTYFVYPAAPPWYVAEYGLGPARMSVRPTPAAASRFDAILGTHLFDAWYGHGIDVFGAIPSLHVAYPFMAMVFAFGMPELRWARWPTTAFFLLMCLSAVYLQHHYVLDEIFGVAYAIAALAIVAAWERREPTSARAPASCG